MQNLANGNSQAYDRTVPPKKAHEPGAENSAGATGSQGKGIDRVQRRAVVYPWMYMVVDSTTHGGGRIGGSRFSH